MNMNRKAKQVMNWTPGLTMRRGRPRKNGRRPSSKTCEDWNWRGKMLSTHGGQRWLEETHCPMCCPAREGLWS